MRGLPRGEFRMLLVHSVQDTKMKHHTPEEQSEIEKLHKMDALRDMISNAEKTIQSAKAMLLQLEGKKKLGRKRKIETEEEGTVVEGTFDGQIMMGTDGKQYPVPANYASKSKLVEGDMLKLTITSDGSFVYKQIGPIERRHALGIVSQDERGNYFVFSEGKPYKVLLASVTYFKAEPGDEVAIMFPRDIEATWAAIENVLQKGGSFTPSISPIDDEISSLGKKHDDQNTQVSSEEIVDEWSSEIEELERELKAEGHF